MEVKVGAGCSDVLPVDQLRTALLFIVLNWLAFGFQPEF